ncbi:M14 family zinc carboxypeptidase [Nocardioides sp. GY 10127]|uniref:M14 family zinc carboxypeptidase n=1 Tax=Nocardioides sp. GY 10127 TaxID=2569762 RepID=UPI0010A87400|nr:M14 family zinc carboxypeptidase [Nocardioides sp. GY 10127]TIC81658.1 murein peptide amidase A [Nocardioides sp. GY 10127]
MLLGARRTPAQPISQPISQPMTPFMTLVTVLVTGLALLAPLGGGTASAADSADTAARGKKNPAVVARRKIGESVQGRAIMAYHLGEPARAGVPKVVVISTMHGNEDDTRVILRSLVTGDPVVGVDLWVIPVYNPDGLAAGTRKNAHGVDLNRNWPYRWTDLDGNYESGSGPASEPETKAVMAFLKKVQPQRLLSFHQPLYGVDTDTKKPAYAKRVARVLKLPRKTFNCGGVCHGTMTSWYNHRFDGAALTAEYGDAPNHRFLATKVARRVLKIFGGSYGGLEWGSDATDATA